MESVSGFRGMSGEVIRGFLKPRTFLTIIPVILFWLLFFLVLSFVGNYLSSYLFLLFGITAGSVLIARFAIPASHGKLNSGLFNKDIPKGETLAFISRYFIYTLFWLLPTFLIAYYFLDTESVFTLFRKGGGSIVGEGIEGLIIGFIMMLWVFFPTICCILAAETSSIKELFTVAPLRWLYHERRHDLSTFYAAILGGLLVFCAKYLVPLLILDLLVYKLFHEAGTALSLFIYLIPLLASPILIGRLSGVFIAGEASIDEVLSCSKKFGESITAGHTIREEGSVISNCTLRT